MEGHETSYVIKNNSSRGGVLADFPVSSHEIKHLDTKCPLEPRSAGDIIPSAKFGLGWVSFESFTNDTRPKCKMKESRNGGKYDPSPSAESVYKELHAEAGANHDSSAPVRVTSHAEQKFLERVDACDPFSRSRIKREFEEAEEVELRDDRIIDPTRLHPESGVAYVYDPDDNTVLTCFRPTEEQIRGAPA